MVFSNARDTAIIFVVEPWGETYMMAPQTKFTLLLRSVVQPCPAQTVEVEYAVDRITVYGWQGSPFTLLQGGEKVSPPGSLEWPRVPGIPE